MGDAERTPRCRSVPSASCKATNAPVTLAVRVPPSAWITSQSSFTVRSPRLARSVTARRERPIRRWISCVRPDCFPRAASRSVRVWVERGSMPYSAVTQPRWVLRIQGGTLSSTEAVHSTWVSPNFTRHEPSAWREKPGSRDTLRSWSGARPDGRICGLLGVGQGLWPNPGPGTSAPAALGDADQPAALAKAVADQGDHERALGEDGQRHDHQDHQQLLDAGQDRGAEGDGNDADGKGDVDGQRLQNAAEADPPHVDRAEQPRPQVGPASDRDASLRFRVLEAVFAQGHGPI